MACILHWGKQEGRVDRLAAADRRGSQTCCIIAPLLQERMANNHVYVFKKSQPSKYSYVSECRSVVEGSTRTVSTMQVKMLSRAGQKSAGQCIRASIPYVRADIPILVIFRALGFVVRRLRLLHPCVACPCVVACWCGLCCVV